MRGEFKTAVSDMRGEIREALAKVPTKHDERNYFLGYVGVVITLAFAIVGVYFSSLGSNQTSVANGIEMGRAQSETAEKAAAKAIETYRLQELEKKQNQKK